MVDSKPAFACDYQRMWDLVRCQRAELLDIGLITQEEYTILLTEETHDKPGQGSPSARRLETYDALRAKVAQAHKEVERWFDEGRDAREHEPGDGSSGIVPYADSHRPGGANPEAAHWWAIGYWFVARLKMAQKRGQENERLRGALEKIAALSTESRAAQLALAALQETS